ncbi:YaaC family protein [Neobacillus drentensis]|uniref:YaaC family protein n=1 Tax=Neobacillus drentensis TaxID=220684 RepID=UPI002FFE1478
MRRYRCFEVKLEPSYSTNQEFAKITGFGIDHYYENTDFYTLRLNKKFYWNAPRNNPDMKSVREFKRYYENHRKRFRYIYSANKLWYIKRKNLQNNLIDRGTLPLTFAAMHRLSEMSRYDPNTLEKHLEKSYGWLLSEFITKSIYQFIDMISSEITGDDFRITGFRT